MTAKTTSRIRRTLVCGVVAALVVAVLPAAQAAPVRPTRAECQRAWFAYQYADIAPGFQTGMSPAETKRLYPLCRKAGLLPNRSVQVRLTRGAFNQVAQILEREIRRVSLETGTPPCEALVGVLKPVGAYGAPLGPRDDVEGYAPDSFLPILKYNWYGGPFRLKFGVGCEGAPYANLWFFADPYPPADSHPARYPSDDETMKDPWPRTPVQGNMSTCITWGPGLDNDGVGGQGFIFAFGWDRENLPLDVRSCYPKALGLDGLDGYPFTKVPNLPLP